MQIHGPRGPDGAYTYPKMETIITEVHQEAEQMTQENASSAGENTNTDASPMQEVDMSQLYISKTGKQNGRIMGLNYAKTQKTITSGPGSTSLGISNATFADVDARVAQMEA